MTYINGALTQKKIAALNEAEKYGDGCELYLVVGNAGNKYWILRTVIKGRRTDMGLGGLDYTPIQEARQKAQELRAVARKGGDSRAERKKTNTNLCGAFRYRASRALANMEKP